MIEDWTHWHRLVLTLAVAGTALAVRWLAIRRIRQDSGILKIADRRAISVLHHGSVVIVLATVILVWLPQLQEFMLSITAIAVALVVATKELLLCLLGTLLIRTSRAFVIGDWIAVQDRFGEVIEKNLLSTMVQEVEPRGYTYTGRTVVLPNSLFLGASVANQNFLKRYQFHAFSITIEPDAFPFDAEERLVGRIRNLTAPFADVARRYNQMLELRTGIDIPDAEPSIEFTTNDTAKIVTTMTVFCPTERIAGLEKAMVREFFDWYRTNRDGSGAHGARPAHGDGRGAGRGTGQGARAA